MALRHGITDGKCSSFAVAREVWVIGFHVLSIFTAKAQFPKPRVLQSDSVDRLLTSKVLGKPFIFVCL